MKVLPFSIPKPENANLVFQEDIGEKFYDKLHQHQEIQLSCILQGEGSFFIGDSLGSFQKGDIFMIGEHVPHVFSSEPQKDKAHMISLFFTQQSYGRQFFDSAELSGLKKVFKSCERGFKVNSNHSRLKDLLLEMREKSPVGRVIGLLQILEILSKSRTQILSSPVNSRKYGEEEGKRMRDIMEYTFQNFDRKLGIAEVAAVANMTPNAFCRYFKQRTKKTYIAFLLEIRVGHACKLLHRNREMNIAEIAFRSGFNNLTNFNRKFKSIKGLTPTAYRAMAS